MPNRIIDMLPPDPASIAKMVESCLNNPQGEMFLVLYDNPGEGHDDSRYINLQIQGGDNLAGVLFVQAVHMGNAEKVANFITRVRAILNTAEVGIEAVLKHRSQNN